MDRYAQEMVNNAARGANGLAEQDDCTVAQAVLMLIPAVIAVAQAIIEATAPAEPEE